MSKSPLIAFVGVCLVCIIGLLVDIAHTRAVNKTIIDEQAASISALEQTIEINSRGVHDDNWITCRVENGLHMCD